MRVIRMRSMVAVLVGTIALPGGTASAQQAFTAVHRVDVVEFVPIDGLVIRYSLPAEEARREPLQVSQDLRLTPSWTEAEKLVLNVCESSGKVCLGVVPAYRPKQSPWRSQLHDPVRGRVGRHIGVSVTIPLGNR